MAINVFYNEILEGNVSLKMGVFKKPGKCTCITIFPVLNTESPNRKKIGKCNVRVESDKRAELEDIIVQVPYRRKGVGTRMLQLVVDYLRDRPAMEIWGDPYGAEDPEGAMKFYSENGFTIVNEHMVLMVLSKPQNPQFLSKHKIERITDAEFESCYKNPRQ
jgi:hypothetical protein